MESEVGIGTWCGGVADELINSLVKSFLMPGRLRVSLLRWRGALIGRGAIIKGGSRFEAGSMEFGDRVWVSSSCRFDARLVLEDDVAVGPGVVICTWTHDASRPNRRAGTARCEPVRLSQGTWVGAQAVILPGVTVATGCV